MFKIVNRAGAIEEQQMNKKIAKPDARKLLKSNLDSNMAKITDPWLRTRVDTSDALKHIKQYKKDYERTAPEKLTAGSKNVMWKRAKLLKDSFTVGMLSREELHPVKTFETNGKIQVVVNEERMASLNTVQREGAWQNKNNELVREFKNIMRHLNPDNPHAGDIERFRPKRRDR